MKKSYIVASILIVLVVIGMIAFAIYNKYGPNSDQAILKGRVEYMLESCGALNAKEDTWSNYKPNDMDLNTIDPMYLAAYLGKTGYTNAQEARETLLQGVFFEITEVKNRDGKYTIMVEFTRPDQSKTKAFFVFVKEAGGWAMDSTSYLETAIYVGNGIGGNGNFRQDANELFGT